MLINNQLFQEVIPSGPKSLTAAAQMTILISVCRTFLPITFFVHLISQLFLLHSLVVSWFC